MFLILKKTSAYKDISRAGDDDFHRKWDRSSHGPDLRDALLKVQDYLGRHAATLPGCYRRPLAYYVDLSLADLALRERRHWLRCACGASGGLGKRLAQLVLAAFLVANIFFLGSWLNIMAALLSEPELNANSFHNRIRMLLQFSAFLRFRHATARDLWLFIVHRQLVTYGVCIAYTLVVFAAGYREKYGDTQFKVDAGIVNLTLQLILTFPMTIWRGWEAFWRKLAFPLDDLVEPRDRTGLKFWRKCRRLFWRCAKAFLGRYAKPLDAAASSDVKALYLRLRSSCTAVCGMIDEADHSRPQREQLRSHKSDFHIVVDVMQDGLPREDRLEAERGRQHLDEDRLSKFVIWLITAAIDAILSVCYADTGPMIVNQASSSAYVLLLQVQAVLGASVRKADMLQQFTNQSVATLVLLPLAIAVFIARRAAGLRILQYRWVFWPVVSVLSATNLTIADLFAPWVLRRYLKGKEPRMAGHASAQAVEMRAFAEV